MKSFRLWAMSALTLVTVGWLQADTLPVDPTIKFTTGGHGTTPITCDTNIPTCTTALVDLIGADGFANLVVKNASAPTPKDIVGLQFVIPTLNFNQDFFASTDAFLFASILPDEGDSQLIVSFSGVGSGTGGSAFLAADPLGPTNGGIPGFAPGGTVFVTANFGTVPAGSTLSGLAFGQTGTLGLAAVPEPGTFWLSLSVVAGVLLARRKLAVGARKS